MTRTNDDPEPTLDANRIIPPDQPHHPQESVGSEGGASLVGTPRNLEADPGPVRSYPAGHEKNSVPTPSSPSKDDLARQE